MRIGLNKATVIKILSNDKMFQKVLLDYGDGHQAEAIVYTCFASSVSIGDIVLANTTAKKLSLGTGGYDFVVCNLSNPDVENIKDKTQGHIMKLPYTPLQAAVLSAEEESSGYHDIFNGDNDLAGTPVIICGLHSHIVPASAVLKYYKPNIRTAYIMTDAAALSVDISENVRILRGKAIDKVVTCGNAFGGDIETINIYSALLAAKYVDGASDIIIVSMGPGVKGTETYFGHSSLEQGWIIDAVNTLYGKPVYCPRISFADKRARHIGISHHSLTVLSKIAKTGTQIAFPYIDEKEKSRIIDNQIEKYRLRSIHKPVYKKTDDTENILKSFESHVNSMGRSFNDDPYFFKTAGSAALQALELLKNG